MLKLGMHIVSHHLETLGVAHRSTIIVWFDLNRGIFLGAADLG